MNEIAENARQIRFLAALEQLSMQFPVAELARKTGYSEGTISPYLTSKALVSEKFLRKFSETFGFDAEALINGPSNENAQSLVEEPGVSYNVEASWARIDKAIQAAVEAAQAATSLARDVSFQIRNHEERLQAAETMLAGLQEFVTVRFAKNENTTRQEVGAALGKAVMDVAKQKRKDTQTANSTSNKVS